VFTSGNHWKPWKTSARIACSLANFKRNTLRIWSATNTPTCLVTNVWKCLFWTALVIQTTADLIAKVILILVDSVLQYMFMIYVYRTWVPPGYSWGEGEPENLLTNLCLSCWRTLLWIIFCIQNRIIFKIILISGIFPSLL
jgi:hypothetical protein